MKRLQREQYAVGEARRSGVGVTVGVYYPVPIVEDIEELTIYARELAQFALAAEGGNHLGIVEVVQLTLDTDKPDRPFYVETRENGKGVQVYQPYGMPQDAECQLDARGKCITHGPGVS